MKEFDKIVEANWSVAYVHGCKMTINPNLSINLALQAKSKSSLWSPYSITCFLIFDVSVQVTKSSMFLVTRKAGSVITSGPTRMWPCSMNLTASFTACAISKRTKTTDSRRRQNVLAGSFSHKDKLFLDSIKPIEYSFSNNSSVASARKESFGSSCFILFAREVTSPLSLLYFV